MENRSRQKEMPRKVQGQLTLSPLDWRI